MFGDCYACEYDANGTDESLITYSHSIVDDATHVHHDVLAKGSAMDHGAVTNTTGATYHGHP